MVIAGIAVVTDNLEPSYHGADGEEPQNFRAHDAEGDELVAVGVSDSGQEGGRAERANGRAGLGDQSVG